MGVEIGSQMSKGVRIVRYKGYIKIVRYADDFVILTETEAQAIKAKDTIARWLETKGLELSAEKTHITHLNDGFDFLGFTVIRRKNFVSKSGYGMCQ